MKKFLLENFCIKIVKQKSLKNNILKSIKVPFVIYADQSL